MASIQKVLPCLLQSVCQGRRGLITSATRLNTFTATDGVAGKPVQSKLLSYVLVSGAVISGVSMGAWMSKNIASFLEENELFVPSDDDDDY